MMRTVLESDQTVSGKSQRPSRVVRLLLAMTDQQVHEGVDRLKEFPGLETLRHSPRKQRNLRDSQVIERRLTS